MKKQRSAFMMIELTMSLVALSVLLIVVAQLMAGAAVRIRSAQQRMFAIESAGNLLERVTAYDFQEISNELVNDPPMIDFLQSFLADWDVQLVVTEDDSNSAKKIVVSLASKNEIQSSRNVTRLVTWKYDESGGTP